MYDEKRIIEKRIILPAHSTCSAVHASAIDAFSGMAVAGASCADCYISDSVIVRFQYMQIAKNFITKRIQSVESDSQIRRLHPFL